MDRHNYPANEVRTIQLPSGRRVDVGYLDDTVVSIDERSPAFVGLEAEIEETVSELLHCGACDCTMVQPVEWDGCAVQTASPAARRSLKTTLLRCATESTSAVPLSSNAS